MSNLLPPETLDAMWWSGFCLTAVKAASHTTADANGEQERKAWLKEHLPYCRDCQLATIWKNLEHRVAERIGQVEEFMSGQGPDMETPEAKEAMGEVLAEAINQGIVKRTDMLWVHTMSKRHGAPWPDPNHPNEEGDDEQ